MTASSPLPSAYEPRFPLGGFLPTIPAGQTIAEPARQIPVAADCDVVVLGGGPAGVCAAAAAARTGASVVLIERYGFFGGTATAANVNIWHSLYAMDGRTQVIGGLPDEVIRRLQRWGGVRNSRDDGETGTWAVDTELAKLAYDDVVLGSGVKVLLHTWLAGAITDGRRVAAAVVENKSGRHAVKARVFIDCTGDADLVRRAGLDTQLGNGAGFCQPPTLCFRVQVKQGPVVPLHQVQAELFKTPMDYNGQPYACFLWGCQMPGEQREYMLAGTRVLGVNVADARDLTRAEIEARYQMRWVYEKMRPMAGWSDSRITDIAAQIGLRESHRILADHQLTREELLTGQRFDDAIAQSTYRIDIHHVDGPGITFEGIDGHREIIYGDRTRKLERWDGRPADAPPRDTLCYFVPYRSLIPRGLDNVLAAGRCIGTNHDAAGATRVMINAMSFGQAAGTAAEMAAHSRDVRQVDPSALRARLKAAGVPLL